ncbi:MAG TPA: hypothetical protein VMU30_11915 [Bacteroidota bacterium]|nr:hypothetical protein [Bacteroidota bacterium]
MQRKLFIGILSTAAIVVALAAFADASPLKHREIQRGKERKLQVVMEVSYGAVTIEHGAGNNAVVLDYDEADEARNKLQISYDVSNGCGYLHIRSKESTHFWGGGDSDNNSNKHHLYIKLTDALPIDFDLSLGAGNSDIDLTDLQVNELKISTGASSMKMHCDKLNRLSANDVTIESGVSSFKADGLCNLNFRNLKFSGGIGSYKLDFGGSLAQSARVKVEVGLGSITITVPKSIPSKLFYDDNWLSSIHVDDDFEKIHSGEYQTEDFNNATARLTFDVEAGLGSVKIRRAQ